jgi:insulysin
MTEFYNAFISPSSPTRSKLSIHLVAQGTATGTADSSTLSSSEKSEKFLLGVEQFLNSSGVEVDSETLKTRLAEVDVASGDMDAIVTAFHQYLTIDMKIDASRAKEIQEQAVLLLGTTLPSLGIEVLPSKEKRDMLTDGKETDVSQKKESVIIENVHEFKAKMAVSAGAFPVKHLSEFEETEPKL